MLLKVDQGPSLLKAIGSNHADIVFNRKNRDRKKVRSGCGVKNVIEDV